VYQRLQDQLATVNETFYVDGKLDCQSLLTTSLDVDGYLQSISSSIQDLEEWLEQWVQALSKTWAADAFKWSVFTALQEFYTDHTQELFNEFRTFKNEQFSLRSSRIVDQRTKVQELQEMRSRYIQASW
jgi:ribosomal protein L29